MFLRVFIEEIQSARYFNIYIYIYAEKILLGGIKVGFEVVARHVTFKRVFSFFSSFLSVFNNKMSRPRATRSGELHAVGAAVLSDRGS